MPKALAIALTLPDRVPVDDLPELATLGDACRAEIEYWLRGVAGLAGERQCLGADAAFRRLGAGMGLSGKRARNLVRDFIRANGDWRVFVNRKKYQPATLCLPPLFVEFWRSHCEQNQRACAPAWRAMLRVWQSGADIPGYPRPAHAMPGTPWPPPSPGTDIPAGWSYGNLIRHAPEPGELAAARRGRTAAKEFVPPVFGTRVGLRVGQYYAIDDIWHDHKVHVAGQRQARRPLEFHAQDLASAFKVAWGITAQLEDMETGRMRHLSKVQVRFLVVALLSTTGYNREGCTFLAENATAQIDGVFERDLHDVTGGGVRVETGGMQGLAAFAGQYAGRSKGNYKFKAALESGGNLIHNELAMLPGQVGSNARLTGPEELHGRERYHDALCRALVALPPDLIQAVLFPFIELELFRSVAMLVYGNINARTEHDLEGWIECGHVAHEYRLAPSLPWLPAEGLLALPPGNQAAIRALLDAGEHLTRVRRKSPAEVFNAGRGNLVRLQPHQAALLLGPDLRVERRVRRGLFEFEDSEVGPGSFRYLAVADAGSQPLQLKDGERYNTVLNPIDRSFHVFDARGRWLGQCAAWEAVRRDDVEALHRQMGLARRAEAELLYPVARRGAALTRERIDLHRHNAAVFAEAGERGIVPVRPPASPAERQRRNDASEDRARVRAERTAVSELLAPSRLALDEPASAPDDVAISDLF